MTSKANRDMSISISMHILDISLFYGRSHACAPDSTLQQSFPSDDIEMLDRRHAARWD